ncbi:hypothetical protein AURDEDRAFT_161267 [Auricularia subglabra TFB-10046 SS5]|nr:hypothetical protein AURDEDRAFT_161267 [Auricularia subglabra TFB-10046 SS5]
MVATQLFIALASAVAASAAAVDTTNSTAAAAISLPSGWKLTAACVTDEGDQRVFTHTSKLALQRNVLLDMTHAKCLNLCSKNGYGYAAIRLGTECFCGSSKPVIRKVPSKECSQHCSGDKTGKQTCGGDHRSAVYTNSKLAGKKPALKSGTPALASGWKVAYKCVNDPTLGESLLKSTKVFELQNNTPLVCTNLCKGKGYTLAGVEYGNECMCGKGWLKGARPAQVSENECNFACTGDSRVTCGAGHRVQLYRASSQAASPEL